MNKDQLNSFGKDAHIWKKYVSGSNTTFKISRRSKNITCLYPLADNFTGFLYFNDRSPQILDLNGEVSGLIREIDDYTVI